MEIRSVDERTGEREVYSPTFRVHFWERGMSGEGLAQDKVGYGVSAYEITGANDVFEVLAWASQNSGAGKGTMYPGADRTYELYVVASGADGPSIVRLAGVNPTSFR